ncbi:MULTISPECIES: hypothetical protein [unclassified Streptomyces]|uniref:hypothetical protein n=1 Tax=unclassified Streptomyces TaxID=2593676 RepID=UPI00088AF28B|nr:MULTISPECIES: hypothetical protein [unclassified Streptomyces]PBC84637.1 hypothetical protein BX261_4631 [Streptomyces sp. 2321.6]SDR28757.1 hypothetical protein SAMN05216511_2631 [Streptomyces sp. KS_16]SED38773.1 hypothetical protein SAMN05428940_4658 [Streptomyces sp. 2133.1]SEE47464.1 hypothetical protein SAMN05428954_2732 [Streptomyces sp. 2112.3]SNC70659.1 hypothetical protein SAMN06272741_4558 [Streptomyces sp. 2114.4]
MAYESRTPELREAPDIAQVLKANRLALARLMTVRLLIGVLLVAGSVILLRVTGSDSFFLALPIPVGVGVLIMTVWRAVYGTRVSQCEKVLRHYPLEFRPRVLMKRAKWTEYGDVHQIRVPTRGQHGAPLMLAVNAAGRRCWPEGAEEGAWLAGDLPFGGVLVVPGSNAMLFLKPADWDKTARKREEADAQRIARAHQAGLHRMTNRSWMMRRGA